MDKTILISAIIVAVLIAITFLYGFVIKTKSEKLKEIKKWLLYAVTEAEKALGSKTGKAKLGYVYEKFTKMFPIVSVFMSFDSFSKLVDEALDEMKEVLVK